jgi:hypothetical protein
MEAVNPLDDFAGIVFRGLVAAVARSATPIQNIEINLRDTRWALKDASFCIPPRMEPEAATVLAGLKKLHLVVQASASPGPVFLKKFLSLAPNLTWLRINTDSGHYDELFTWLGEAVPSNQAAADSDNGPTIHLPLLEQLDFGNASLLPETLVKIVAKFAPSLRILSLRRVNLVGTTDPKDRISPWSIGFLWKLRQIPGIDLRRLDLSLLAHTTAHGWRGTVAFQDPPRPLTFERSYRAGKTEELVKQVLASINVSWPEDAEDDADSGDDEEDEEDDEEMDDEEEAENDGDEDNDGDNDGDDEALGDDEMGD